MPAINNQAFDDWSETNYHRKIYNNLEGPIFFNAVFNKYDLSLQVVASRGDYRTSTIYTSRSLTGDNSPITSFII